jgi:iron complex outermembrane receptor protein
MCSRRISILALIGLVLANPTLAQQLDEILVTAQKRVERLQSVPISLSTFSSDQLHDLGIEDTQSLHAVAPGVVFNNRGPIAQPFIRGVGTTLSLLGLESSVASYVDDQYYPRPVGGIMELPDIERIEILKGPQGVLYGRNATGGAVRIVTRNPGENPGARVKLSGGSYDYYKVSAYVEGALTDTLSANASSLSAQRDGFARQREPGLNDLDDLDVQTYRGKLRWLGPSSIVAQLAFDYTQRADTSGAETIDITSDKSPVLGPFSFSIGPALAEGLGGPVGPAPIGHVVATGKSQDAVRSGVDGNNRLAMFNAQLNVDLTLEGMVFSSITTYQDSESEINTADFDASGLIMSDVYDEEENRAISQEFRIRSENDSRLSWLAGTYYFESEGEYQIWFDARELASAGFQTLASPRSALDTTAWAVFGQGTYRFNDVWALTLGGRYSVEDKSVQTSLANGDDDWAEFTPKAVLEYHWDRGMGYLSYSQGFKSGGFAYPFIKGLSDASVDAEVLEMWELGVKTDLLDNTLRVNGSLYFYDYEDLQVNRNAGLVPGVGIVLPVENAGGAEAVGLEVDLTWRATTQLTFTAGLNAMDTQYTRYQATPSVYNTTDIPGPVVVALPSYNAAGDDMIRAPEFSAYLSLNYNFELSGGASVPLNLLYSHKSSYNFDLIPGNASNRVDEYKSEAYELLNARIAYVPASERWSLALWGRNLTDEEYFDEVVAFATAVRATVGAPRTYGVDVIWGF